ncbi:RNA 3'-terminal phosphate cyclase-domain-containing protein [Astrocystis sublimbata]|nr:RNA 3'-terminal phosphate cyclase-domain-containing protein [Astrocystis sublimbata]
MAPHEPLLVLDGSTGEGGGQLVRLACALAAVTSSPVRITNVRANRSRGGGLKSQHVTAIAWLAKATQAEVTGLVVGSQTLDVRPKSPPTTLENRNIVIKAESRGASALLILQAVFPYLLFAGNENSDPIELEIHGSTNASFSPSYEYLDQVLLPTLEERFGILAERQLKKRAWTIGPLSQGIIWLKFQPVSRGQVLKLVKPWNSERQPGDLEIERIDVSILVPNAMLEAMQNVMVQYIAAEFPEAEVNFVVSEESGHDARMYVLAVAKSRTGLRWGRDFLYDRSAKKKQVETIAKEIAKTVTKKLREQMTINHAAVDEHLQDQLVVFQALAEGRTTYWSRETETRDKARSDPADTIREVIADLENLTEHNRERKDRTHKPFGFGSTHTITARWVASEVLPTVKWYNNGTICEGAGISF